MWEERRTDKRRVFECGRYALLVVQLLVDRRLRSMSTGGDVNIDLKAIRQGAQELDTNAQSDQSRHRAVRNGRGEVDLDMRFLVVDLDEFVFCDIQLFQSERVLRVIDFSDEVCTWISNLNSKR